MDFLIDEHPRSAARSPPVAATPSSDNQPHLVKRGPRTLPGGRKSSLRRLGLLLTYLHCVSTFAFFYQYMHEEDTLTEQLVITVLGPKARGRVTLAPRSV
jgi:hypothetical protein